MKKSRDRDWTSVLVEEEDDELAKLDGICQSLTPTGVTRFAGGTGDNCC